MPPELAAVSLIDAKTCAAPGSMSLSWWYEQVASGKAPQPVIRAPRCTRWRVSDVVEFWRQFSELGSAAAATQLLAQAKRASISASAKRRSAAQAGE